MKRKLTSKRGETLVEVLVSLIIVIMIISMLPLALETAARINAKVKSIDTICPMEKSNPVAVSFKIVDASGAILDTVNVQGYSENGFTYYTGN